MSFLGDMLRIDAIEEAAEGDPVDAMMDLALADSVDGRRSGYGRSYNRGYGGPSILETVAEVEILEDVLDDIF